MPDDGEDFAVGGNPFCDKASLAVFAGIVFKDERQRHAVDAACFVDFVGLQLRAAFYHFSECRRTAGKRPGDSNFQIFYGFAWLYPPETKGDAHQQKH